MHGFGNLEGMDELKAFTEAIEEKDLIKDREYTPEEQAKLENITIPVLEETWVEEKPKAKTEGSDTVKNKPEEGAAGNKEPEEGKEKEPIMGGIGGVGGGMGLPKAGGMSIKPELEKKALDEGLEDGAVVDEKPKEEAKKRTEASMVLSKAKDMFDEMYGSSFGKQKEFDFDSEKNCGTKISKEPINRIPKGW